MSIRLKHNQQEADSFDAALYRLIIRAEGYAERNSCPGTWQAIVRGLRAVRPKVRGMMSEEDRARTE